MMVKYILIPLDCTSLKVPVLLFLGNPTFYVFPIKASICVVI